MKKKKYYRTGGDYENYVYESLDEISIEIKNDELAVGDKRDISIECIEMTEKEYSELPEN